MLYIGNFFNNCFFHEVHFIKIEFTTKKSMCYCFISDYFRKGILKLLLSVSSLLTKPGQIVVTATP